MATEFQSLVGDLVPTPEAAPEPVETPKVETDTPAEPVEDKKPVDQTGLVPLPVFMEVKHDLNALRKENIELRNRFDQLQTPGEQVSGAPPPEAKPDPLQAFIAKYTKDFNDENGHDPEMSEIPVPASIMLARDDWQRENAALAQEQQSIQIRKDAIRIASTQTMTDEAFGAGLGLDAVVSVGNKYLTEGDKLDISQAGDQCAVVMYRKCVERAAQSRTPEGLDLAKRISEKYQADNKSGVTAESLASETPKNNEQAETPPETPPASAEEAIGRHPNLSRLGLKGLGRSA